MHYGLLLRSKTSLEGNKKNTSAAEEQVFSKHKVQSKSDIYLIKKYKKPKNNKIKINTTKKT